MLLKSSLRSAGVAQGVWWTLTDQLDIDLRLLLATLPSGAGPVERVIYNENDWAPAPLRMKFRGHSVILEPSNTTINTVTVTGKKFGTLALLVVHPESTHAAYIPRR